MRPQWLLIALACAATHCSTAAHADDVPRGTLTVDDVLEQVLGEEEATTTTIDGVRYRTGYRGPSLAPVDRVYLVPQVRPLPDSYTSAEVCPLPIKNQGNCGSCYAFATERALECAAILAGYPTPIDLAEQDKVSNDRTSYGCGGGFMQATFETKYGVTGESHCPYKAQSRARCSGPKFVKATKWAAIGTRTRAPTNDELKAAIYEYGQVVVTVAAGGAFSPDRTTGRITRCSSPSVNHMVTISGWRPTPGGSGPNDVEFLIDNSWGTGWGVGGRAWSKRGCNKLASTPGEAALVIYVDPIAELR